MGSGQLIFTFQNKLLLLQITPQIKMGGAGRATRHFYYEGKPAEITNGKKGHPKAPGHCLNGHLLERRCVRQMMMAFNHRWWEKLSFLEDPCCVCWRKAIK
ncbi:hypothetical protein CEXT_93501 [Caerostris extrusa]|uniref:Uncharacterized protein n=1 Tax=Caerostris extrusa TaxID=172846 RepID=A0AAV4QGR0_CAEEX|nr:hypothetical protein CEXT_93501 [Caerostris extrusa]